MTDIWAATAPPLVAAGRDHYEADIVIIGSGAGGATTAWALAGSGARVLVLERGGFLPREPENWSPRAVFAEQLYHNAEAWRTPEGRRFVSSSHYYVGGTTKVYGASLPRLRESDFGAVEHYGGTSPAWPFGYRELEPFYAEAERLYRVHGWHGSAGSGDPTAPPRSGPFPHPAVEHEPYVADLERRLRGQGLHPHPLELGIDLGPGRPCLRCGTCDGFPCRVGAKSDAETRALRPALRRGNVRLLTHARVTRLDTDRAGRAVRTVHATHRGRPITVTAARVVLSAGAINSAALLLRSANDQYPDGLANGSGLVGRNLMLHNNSVVVAVDPRRRNPVTFQKTLAVNDFYHHGPAGRYPLGNLQLMGKVRAEMLPPRLPHGLRSGLTGHSLDWWVMSEDLPDPRNRVTLAPDGQIVLRREPNNLRAHRELVRQARRMLRRAGYPLVFARRMGIDATGHQCGTTVAGADEARSVLDPYCRSHQLRNLYVVDGGFFPSSAAVNPTLTIVAQALRTAGKGGLLD
ncbi:GMC family oxidoreductase [Kitasatospora viridis]|uniref:Choline dehydrogenase-like flavoprotein n=1 Tax=Kitasatospora viridis TaxID=281105 RepID=A0A561TSR1_9ACTN|nr:GMC family oxidoreductase [Kitasatospora viridis]TWF90149.1 choline dehydrogenase-like flavoprotein [Kitasatospora viridis]